MFIQRIRVRFQKRDQLKAISHLDLMRSFERTLRRTGMPLRMSEGFNPRPRISFPMPLGVGMEGLDEVMEFELADWVYPPEVERRLREQLPNGLELLSATVADPGKSAQGRAATYEVAPSSELAKDPRLNDESLRSLLAREEIPVRRIRKGREKTVNVRPFVLDLARRGDNVVLRVKADSKGSTRPEEILRALGFDDATCRTSFTIARTRVELAD